MATKDACPWHLKHSAIDGDLGPQWGGGYLSWKGGWQRAYLYTPARGVAFPVEFHDFLVAITERHVQQVALKQGKHRQRLIHNTLFQTTRSKHDSTRPSGNKSRLFCQSKRIYFQFSSEGELKEEKVPFHESTIFSNKDPQRGKSYFCQFYVLYSTDILFLPPIFFW